MPLGKLRVAAAPPKHSLNQRSGRDSAWEGVEGGQERGLEEGSAPEHEGPRERRSVQAVKPTPRIHYSKHLPGVSGGVGVGTSASTLADPVRSRQQCGWSSLQTRAPQTLHLESAPRPPPRSPNCTPCCAWSAHSLRPNARPPSSPADSRGSRSQRSPELDRDALHRPTRSLYFIRGTRRRGGETEEERRPGAVAARA